MCVGCRKTGKESEIKMRIALLLITLGFLSSCVTIRNPSLTAHIDKSNCNQENSYTYTKNTIPKPVFELSVDTTLTSRFRHKDINVANAIGILDLLPDYIGKLNQVQQNNSLQNQIDLINIRQKINNRIDLASLEISSVAAELDCEEERINQIASVLKEKEMKTETKLTVGSIILGSLTAVVTGVLVSTHDESDAGDIIGVGVGVASTLLGVMILTNQRKIELTHSRNVLREIWQATETSTVYPPSIWYYLNYPNTKGGISLREQLIENWKNFGQVSSSKTKSKNSSIDIYFSAGGEYTTEQLENRANMYDQIESTIKLMKQDLRNLTLNISTLK